MTAIEEPKTEVQTAAEEGMGSRLRAAREARGFSQTGVSTRSKVVDPTGKGIARTVLVGYEAGHSHPGARELKLLCQILAVTPNWVLFGSEYGPDMSLTSMEAVRKRDAVSVFRLALAVSVLKPHERELLSGVILSMAGREMGDLRLSGLMAMGRHMAEVALKDMESCFKDVGGELVDQSIEDLAKAYSEGLDTNLGNKLRFDEDGEVAGGEWLYSPPGGPVQIKG